MSLKSLTKSLGWQEFLELLEEEKAKLADCRNIKANTAVEKGREAMARSKACELIDNIIRGVDIKVTEIKKRETKYI